MSIARLFMGIGSLYLLLGIGLGMHMAASGDHSLAPLHAHINLLGFVLMTVFGVVYHLFPAAAASVLGRAHFWLHLVGGAVLLVMLALLMTGRITEAAMFPLAPIAEAAIWLGVLAFSANVWRHVP
jgi:cbb3-type cytochrome oxidase subunit 1